MGILRPNLSEKRRLEPTLRPGFPPSNLLDVNPDCAFRRLALATVELADTSGGQVVATPLYAETRVARVLSRFGGKQSCDSEASKCEWRNNQNQEGLCRIMEF